MRISYKKLALNGASVVKLVKKNKKFLSKLVAQSFYHLIFSFNCKIVLLATW